MKAKMYSLHIGVSYVDPDHYRQSLAALPCCRTDAEKMYQLMGLLQYDKRAILLDEDATTDNFIQQLQTWSQELAAGDLLVITYSGHGGSIQDVNFDETSGADQTWCLYDRQLIDDELPYCWREFAAGVNIFILLDSCHSGTASKDIPPLNELNPGQEHSLDDLVKLMPYKSRGEVQTNNWEEVYADVVARVKEPIAEEEIKAAVLLISACEDDEVAKPGPLLSVFTFKLLQSLGARPDIRTYPELYREVRDRSPGNQTPKYYFIGQGAEYFTTNRPFLRPGEDYPEDFATKLHKLTFTNTYAGLGGNRGVLVDLGDDTTETKTLLSTVISEPLEEISPQEIAIESIDYKGSQHPWDEAYDYYQQGQAAGVSVFCEPAFYQAPEMVPSKSIRSASPVDAFLNSWPAPEGHPNPFLWHLDDDFSQLAKAREAVLSNVPIQKRRIRIAHIDTGYRPDHVSAQGLRVVGPRSFIPGERRKNPAVDQLRSSRLIEQDFHGCATLALLAGQEVPAEYAYGGFPGGYIGAIPFAEIVPIRISETVALTGLLGNTKEFRQAIEYAIEMECEVISMSMAGSPSHAWARAINAAYEAGITIVSAAGNSWVGQFDPKVLFPKKVLYPARFDRVIAATGVCYNQQPYLFEANDFGAQSKTAGGETMQGNHLPERAMRTALAAYTPNLPWAELDKDWRSVFRKSGGGTSAATPQIAAAAALWIVQHREQLDALVANGEPWMKVEAVKHALFSHADKSHPLYERYYGQGTLKAYDALQAPVPAVIQLTKAPPARVSWLGLAEFTKLVLLRKADSKAERAVDETLSEMLSLEIMQILHKDARLFHYLDHLDFEQEGRVFENKEQLEYFLLDVQVSPYASETLKRLIIKQ